MDFSNGLLKEFPEEFPRQFQIQFLNKILLKFRMNFLSYIQMQLKGIIEKV